MEPIVHGLSQEFEGRMAFERRNAAEDAVQWNMAAYGLRGHPSFVIAAPDGEALWTHLGPLEAKPLRVVVQQFAAAASAE